MGWCCGDRLRTVSRARHVQVFEAQNRHSGTRMDHKAERDYLMRKCDTHKPQAMHKHVKAQCYEHRR